MTTRRVLPLRGDDAAFVRRCREQHPDDAPFANKSEAHAWFARELNPMDEPLMSSLAPENIFAIVLIIAVLLMGNWLVWSLLFGQLIPISHALTPSDEGFVIVCLAIADWWAVWGLFRAIRHTTE